MTTTNPAYYIFDVSIHDLAGMKIYSEKVESTYKPYGGTRIVRTEQVNTIEGKPPQGSVIILQFASVEQAKAWHNSPEYQEILPYRHACTHSNVWLVEGQATVLN